MVQICKKNVFELKKADFEKEITIFCDFRVYQQKINF